MKIKTAALIAMIGLSLSLAWQFLNPFIMQSLMESGHDITSRASIMAFIGIPASVAHTGSEILLAFALYRAAR